MNNLDRFNKLCADLEAGRQRVAKKIDDTWVVNPQIKEIILEGFKYGRMMDQSLGSFCYFDKNTMIPRNFSLDDSVRIVPGGTAIRRGAYLAKSVVVMPPSYVNIGAYVDEGTMLDSHSLVGSCAQVGKNVHLSAASQLGGVLEPIGALPVIVEDNVFIGGNCGIYEGTIVSEYAVIGSGVIITKSTPIYDAVNKTYIDRDEQGRLIVPPKAVVVPGSRMVDKEAGICINIPVIVKYRDEKTSAAVSLENTLR